MSDIVERLRDPVIRWMSTNQAERREAADEIERLRDLVNNQMNAANHVIERLREALTPSGATKAAYMDEFAFRVCIGYEDDTEIYDTITVPWTTIKEIMAAIRARAALEPKDE